MVKLNILKETNPLCVSSKSLSSGLFKDTPHKSLWMEKQSIKKDHQKINNFNAYILLQLASLTLILQAQTPSPILNQALTGCLILALT